MIQRAIKLPDHAADIPTVESQPQLKEWTGEASAASDFVSPVTALQEQIALSFSAPAERIWSRRRGLAVAVSISLLGWLAIGLSIKALV